MINWFSLGTVDIAQKVTPFIFFLALLIWFLMVKKNLKIKKNAKTLIKIGCYSLIGAALSPLAIVTLQGRLISFLITSFSVLKNINNFSLFQSVALRIFKGFSITGGLLVLTLILLFVIQDGKKCTFAILYPFPIFAFITRINCFLEGCCFGKLYNGAWSVKYPPASFASKLHYSKYGLVSRYETSFSVYPTQLYIVAAMLLLSVAVILMNRFKLKKSVVVGTILVGYGISNFVIEFFREEPLLFNSLTLGQLMEIALVAIGFYLFFKVKESEISKDEKAEKVELTGNLNNNR